MSTIRSLFPMEGTFYTVQGWRDAPSLSGHAQRSHSYSPVSVQLQRAHTPSGMGLWHTGIDAARWQIAPGPCYMALYNTERSLERGKMHMSVDRKCTYCRRLDKRTVLLAQYSWFPGPGCRRTIASVVRGCRENAAGLLGIVV